MIKKTSIFINVLKRFKNNLEHFNFKNDGIDIVHAD